MMQIASAKEPTDPLADALPLGFARISRGDAARPVIEKFIQRRYWVTHRASRCHFLDHLLVVAADPDEPLAVLGIDAPRDRPFLHESYLDAPIEDLIGERTGERPDRSKIIELGNLVSVDSAAATLLMLLSVSWFAGLGATWAGFTATRTVRLRLRALGVPLFDLGVADPARLGPEAAQWGNYYECGPHVVAATFSEAQSLIQMIPEQWSALSERAYADGTAVRHARGVA